MVDWDPFPKIKNFPNLMIFDQKAWTKNDQKLKFLKKNFFLKNLKIGWLTKIH